MMVYNNIKYFILQLYLNVIQSTKGTGSVYTVWGRKSCPAVNGTTTVYTGND